MDKSNLSKKRESSLMFSQKLKFRYERRLFSSIDKFSTRLTDVSSSGKPFADVLLILLFYRVPSLSKDQRDHWLRSKSDWSRSLVSRGEILIVRKVTKERKGPGTFNVPARLIRVGKEQPAFSRAKTRPVILIIVERIVLHVILKYRKPRFSKINESLYKVYDTDDEFQVKLKNVCQTFIATFVKHFFSNMISKLCSTHPKTLKYTLFQSLIHCKTLISHDEKMHFCGSKRKVQNDENSRHRGVKFASFGDSAYLASCRTRFSSELGITRHVKRNK
ncbi:hypothetical protein DBV15_05561 [Temnothorax longispinosus]|uniref:Uncharacterized protein n=1 Tax=Temnothorax longispinosus TaxID=300112 RepID=A0A4S2KUQ5_9HYME|nr:hypothetical protein DBV15_05561 [Temnothorax longispinosus]